MIELHLLRHAHAGDPEAWPGPDATRPLSDKGERQAERLGRFLAAGGFKPDAMISSPRVRALQTAEIVLGQLGLDVEVRVDERLGGGLDLDDVEALLRDAGGPARPVIVGHDPDFSELLATLSGTADMPMRKGAIARLDIAGRLEPGGGVLRWLVPPELLKP